MEEILRTWKEYYGDTIEKEEGGRRMRIQNKVPFYKEPTT